MRSLVVHLAVLSAVSGWALPALSQQCSLSANYRLVNSVGGVPAELTVNSGPYFGAPPLILQRSNQGQNARGCNSQTTATSVANFGSLSFSAIGSANTCPSGGVFLLVDSSGPPPRAAFSDRITAQSSTLPPLAPVVVRVTINFAGSFSSNDVSPSSSLTASASLNSTFLRLSDVGAISGDFTVNIGQPFAFDGELIVNISNAGVQQGPPRTAEFSADYTAVFTITPITPGVTIVTCSGATYAAPSPCPTCAADYDQNGGVDGGDLGAFLADFETGQACADVDQNGGVDGGDLAFFVMAFEAGGC